MNQILSIKNKMNNIKVEFSDEIYEIPYNETIHCSSKKKYFVLLIISIFILALLCFLLFLNIKKAIEQEKLSKNILNNYILTSFYQNNINSNLVSTADNTYKDPFVIGMICIPTIDLSYPILSESDPNLLKISLCRFAGPMPNEVGNLCIAGHNYVDYRFFGKLNKLKKDDLIEIYSLSGEKNIYTIFDKYEVNPNDLSCTSQDVGNEKIVTLSTCNNVNGKRLIIKAKK